MGRGLSVEAAFRAAAARLARAGIEEPARESEFLAAAALDCTRPQLVLRRENPISDKCAALLARWTDERCRRKPLAYITGRQPFIHLDLQVDESVLIPRPETELLVERAYEALDRMDSSIDAADVGTGSGNIALCLAGHPRARRVYGIDISAQALAVARANEARLGRRTVEWRQDDLLSSFMRSDMRLALIAANLPYVRTEALEALDPEVRWEPRLALDGGPDGLGPILRLIEQAQTVLLESGVLLLEIGYDQAGVAENLKRRGLWNDVQLFRDLAGHPRIVQARRKAA